MDNLQQQSIGRLAPDFICGERLDCGGRPLSLRPTAVMGILNITPDSFSDGGELCDGSGVRLDAVLKRAGQMLEGGARILDVGGESTRPGAATVSPQQELDRVAPVVEALAAEFDAVISVDTSTAGVISESARLGAGMINDVRALRRPGALAAAAATGLPVCLMHMQGEPGNMQREPHYLDVFAEVLAFLQQRIEACTAAGIARQKLLIDPGFGFGKTLEHNLVLFRRLAELVETGHPVLVGVSRKSMIGALTGKDADGRLAGSLALAALAAREGAAILRVHDVAPTHDTITMINAVMR